MEQALQGFNLSALVSVAVDVGLESAGRSSPQCT